MLTSELLIAFLSFGLTAWSDDATRELFLDTNQAEVVHIHPDHLTTILLPEVPTGMYGNKITKAAVVDPVMQADFYMLHPEGAHFVNFLALRPDAETNLNLVFDDDIYVIRLRSSVIDHVPAVKFVWDESDGGANGEMSYPQSVSYTHLTLPTRS